MKASKASPSQSRSRKARVIFGGSDRKHFVMGMLDTKITLAFLFLDIAMEPTPLAIELIRTDGGTQMRAQLDKDVYLDYRDKWLSGFVFDPVDVFHDGAEYWLADGFHRYFGAREAKRGSVPCNVRKGTQRDAILFATGANTAHGLRRTNADKRQAVTTLLNDPEWVTWSDRKIAEQAAVSVNFVGEVRKQLSSDDSSSQAAQTADDPKVGKDGKSRKPRKPRNSSNSRNSQNSDKSAENGKHTEPTHTMERDAGQDEPDNPEHVPDPKRPTDKSGNALPDRPELLKAFGTFDLFHSTEAARNVIQSNCLAIAQAIPDGKEFRANIDKALKGLFHLIENYRPAYVCSHCNGGKCPKCKRRGYTTWQSR